MVTNGGYKKIFKSRLALAHHYVPDRLLYREEEINKLRLYLSFALEGDTPPNVVLFGHTGTGKTAVVKFVLRELRERLETDDVLFGYAVASTSPAKTLADVLTDMGVGVKHYRGQLLWEVLDVFKDATRGRIAVVIIDEIDKLIYAGKSEELLYHLTRTIGVSIVAISNKLFLEGKISDVRVLSSWRPRKILFNPYDAEQLRDILEYRASLGFEEGVLEDDVIPYVSAVTVQNGGDVRFGLDVLLTAGDLAIERGVEKIDVDLAKEAVREVEDKYVLDSINKMTDYEKLLLLVVLVNDFISPSEAYQKCNELIEKKIFEGLEKKAYRTWALYRNKLELMGFVELVKKGQGLGRGWRYFIKFPECYDKYTVLQALIGSLPLVNRDNGDTLIQLARVLPRR
ncbi:Cdc6/Cdc18 family protein [Archaeoglobus profundus]|uniref:ORC1-type DNA replication protein n=1 Tax=Archaeoglobus profundus (strain DSM 5631 / JCM 9629 / NBRC 100127 / Av18) TaxID=572546 RepID=D2RDM5_ARCPA|nr:AAA family ATPase [Archaeoglobus profundus]ADB58219.1 orc1/cdc6 family replication initiation protein [Archaeoglobus profundus DSM 5631]